MTEADNSVTAADIHGRIEQNEQYSESELLEIAAAIVREHGTYPVNTTQIREALLRHAPKIADEHPTTGGTHQLGEVLVDTGLFHWHVGEVDIGVDGIEGAYYWPADADDDLDSTFSENASPTNPQTVRLIELNPVAMEFDRIDDAASESLSVGDSIPISEARWKRSPFRVFRSRTLLKCMEAVLDFDHRLEGEFNKSELAEAAGVTAESIRQNAVIERLKQFGLIKDVSGSRYTIWRESPTAPQIEEFRHLLLGTFTASGQDILHNRTDDLPERHHRYHCPECGTRGVYLDDDDHFLNVIEGYRYECPDGCMEWLLPDGTPPERIIKNRARRADDIKLRRLRQRFEKRGAEDLSDYEMALVEEAYGDDLGI